jgi:hypothetical protein
MSQRRLSFIRFVFWTAGMVALVMALIPHPPELPGEPSDKIQHVAAFLTLGALGSFAYPSTNPVRLGAGLSIFGAIIEVLQLIPALHRDGDPLDWMADTAAVALIVFLLRRFVGRRAGETPAER